MWRGCCCCCVAATAVAAGSYAGTSTRTNAGTSTGANASAGTSTCTGAGVSTIYGAIVGAWGACGGLLFSSHRATQVDEGDTASKTLVTHAAELEDGCRVFNQDGGGSSHAQVPAQRLLVAGACESVTTAGSRSAQAQLCQGAHTAQPASCVRTRATRWFSKLMTSSSKPMTPSDRAR